MVTEENHGILRISAPVEIRISLRNAFSLGYKIYRLTPKKSGIKADKNTKAEWIKILPVCDVNFGKMSTKQIFEN
jgi:hypothetical protein